MEAKHRRREQGLAPARWSRHGRERDVLSHHDLRVALKAQVRDGGNLEQLLDLGARVRVLHAHALDECLRQRGSVAGVEPFEQSARQRISKRVENPTARFLARQRLRQERLQLQDLDAEQLEHAAKALMLFARRVTEQDVVEEQLFHHARNHEIDFRPGLVNEDTAQPTDLRCDAYRTHGTSAAHHSVRGALRPAPRFRSGLSNETAGTRLRRAAGLVWSPDG